MSQSIAIDTVLQIGPFFVRLRLQGPVGFTLTYEHFTRRLGAFVSDKNVADGEEDMVVELTTTEGPWPKPGTPAFVKLTASPAHTQPRTVRRADLDAVLNLPASTMMGESAAHLPVVEECIRLLWWLTVTGQHSRGLLIHAASTVKDGKAYCFPAFGGTGKSTLAQLTPGDLALCDEITLLTHQENQWLAWPSPFWNWQRNFDPRASAQQGYPLEAVGFLAQGVQTRFETVRADEALTRLMQQTLAFDAFPSRSAHTFEMAADLIQAMQQRKRLGLLHLLKGDQPYPVVQKAPQTK